MSNYSTNSLNCRLIGILTTRYHYSEKRYTKSTTTLTAYIHMTLATVKGLSKTTDAHNKNPHHHQQQQQQHHNRSLTRHQSAETTKRNRTLVGFC